MKSLLFALVVLCSWINLEASNFHEHLFSLPTHEDVAQSAEAIFLIPESQQRLSSIFKTPSALHRFISSKWGESQANQFLQADGLNKTLTQLCSAMHADPKQGLRTLLSFDLDQESSLEDCKRLYVEIEDVRKIIILALSPDEVDRIFTRYFEQEPLINRQVISVTVTCRFFEIGQQEKYRRLKELAEKYGSHLVYRVSLQRQVLLSEGIALNKESFALIDQGEIAGIDIVGSLNEKRYVYKQSSEQMEEQLHRLFDFISKRSLVLVFHLFEGLSDGPFYDALEKVLRTYKRPLLLEIGHIAHLNAHWMEVFSSNPFLKVLFHVNVRSNELLQGCTLPQIRQTVEKLLALGFAVVPGCDGRGILPGATYTEQTGVLGCALHNKSFLSVQDENLKRISLSLSVLNKLPKMESGLFQTEENLGGIGCVRQKGFGGCSFPHTFLPVFDEASDCHSH